MSLERIQKILARAGVASRRKAEELIVEGRVTVNGRVAELGEKANPLEDSLKVDGKRVHLPREHRYLLLNKPKGYVTTVADPEGRPTVMDLVPPQFRKALVPVGRLDFQTEGLLLLTDDGEFALRLSHPRYGTRKTYAVKVKGTPEEEGLDKLRAGVVIDGQRTSPCKIRERRLPAGGREIEAGNSWWTVELFEGRTRQIREMFFRIGHPVQKLRRVAIGRLEDANLPLGALRELDAREVELLLAGAREGQRPAPAEQRPPSRRRHSEARSYAAREAARRPAGGEQPSARRRNGEAAERLAGERARRPGGEGPAARRPVGERVARPAGERPRPAGGRPRTAGSSGREKPGGPRAGQRPSRSGERPSRSARPGPRGGKPRGRG